MAKDIVETRPISSPSPISPGSARLDYIDALRGFACLWVLLCHALGPRPVEPGVAHIPLWLLVKASEVGWMGVSLFLVLSGFCLYYPLVRRNEPAHIKIQLATFAKRRARRILPPYYAAMVLSLISLAVFARMSHVPLSQLLGGTQAFGKVLFLNLFLLHNLSPGTFVGIVGVSWSLALEAQLYVLFPFLVWFAGQRGLSTLLVVTLIVAVVFEMLVFSRLGTVSVWNPVAATWYQALPGRCFEFVAGMAAAAVVARSKRDLRRPATIGALGCATLALAYAYGIGMFGPLLHPLLGIWFSCLLVLSNRVAPRHFTHNPVLRALTWVGTMSYSLYLVHEVVFKVVRQDRFHIPESSDALVIAFVFVRIAVAVAIGYGFFRLFERPWLVRSKASSAEVVQATALSPAP